MHWNDASRNHYHDNAGSFPRQQHNQREFPNAFSRSISHALYTRWEDCAIVRSCISISTLTLVLNGLNIWIQIRSEQIRLDSWVNGKVWVWISTAFRSLICLIYCFGIRVWNVLSALSEIISRRSTDWSWQVLQANQLLNRSINRTPDRHI